MRTDLEKAAALLNSGGVVAVPTETVYGLAARLTDARAVARIFTLKGRPQDNPLIVHIANAEQLAAFVTGVPAAFAKIKNLWPGPLTLVLSANESAVPAPVRAGLSSVAIRVPGHVLVRDLIDRVGPIVAPSANLSGRPSATTPSHVEADFGAEFPVLDGGGCASGVESTIIALHEENWELLRPGAISAEDLTEALGVKPFFRPVSDKPRSPGQKYRHYAPSAALVAIENRSDLGAAAGAGMGAVLGFDDSPHGALPLLSLGPRGDFTENLRRLYETLRALDDKNIRSALVDFDFPVTGLGATLADRLGKAVKKS